MNDVRISDHLKHMSDAAQDAVAFVEGKTLDAFLQDRRTQQAVKMCLVIIGEASVRISQHYPQFIDQNPQFAWQKIRGMRNRVIHGYFQIDLNTVWVTVTDALPLLLEQIKIAQTDLSSPQ